MRTCKTACGGKIIVPRKAEDHLVAHPEVRDLLSEAIAKLRLPQDGAFLSAEVEMGRVIGRSGCVQTPLIALPDRALFAQRVGRDRPSRVIVGEGVETTKVVILAFAARGEAGTYVLLTSWVGTLARKEPWDRTIATAVEHQDCLQFWCSHALVWDSAVMSAPFESCWTEVLN